MENNLKSKCVRLLIISYSCLIFFLLYFLFTYNHEWDLLHNKDMLIKLNCRVNVYKNKSNESKITWTAELKKGIDGKLTNDVVLDVLSVNFVKNVVFGKTVDEKYFFFDSNGASDTYGYYGLPEVFQFSSLELLDEYLESNNIELTKLINLDEKALAMSDIQLRPWYYSIANGLLGWRDQIWFLVFLAISLCMCFMIGLIGYENIWAFRSVNITYIFLVAYLFMYLRTFSFSAFPFFWFVSYLSRLFGSCLRE